MCWLSADLGLLALICFIREWSSRLPEVSISTMAMEGGLIKVERSCSSYTKRQYFIESDLGYLHAGYLPGTFSQGDMRKHGNTL